MHANRVHENDGLLELGKSLIAQNLNRLEKDVQVWGNTVQEIPPENQTTRRLEYASENKERKRRPRNAFWPFLRANESEILRVRIEPYKV